MITLHEPAHLTSPAAAVRVSYLTGEQADCLLRGTETDWLGPASDDFDDFVAKRCGVSTRWGVPSTVLWYISGEHYLGTLVIRHELTPQLTDVGGNVGYHVVAPWRRQGHATRMLAAGLVECRRLGLDRVLLTCDPENVAEPVNPVGSCSGLVHWIGPVSSSGRLIQAASGRFGGTGGLRTNRCGVAM